VAGRQLLVLMLGLPLWLLQVLQQQRLGLLQAQARTHCRRRRQQRRRQQHGAARQCLHTR
jgi:adenylate kinase